MDLIVKKSGDIHVMDWGEGARRCAVGRSGTGVKKREGDGVTPQGAWPLRKVLYRADVAPPVKTTLPIASTVPADGWCDDPASPLYNTQVWLPIEASAENLWRSDRLYDIVVVVGYNDDPVVAGKGSAIFLHLAHDDYHPTAGCVALADRDLRDAIRQFTRDDRLRIY